MEIDIEEIPDSQSLNICSFDDIPKELIKTILEKLMLVERSRISASNLDSWCSNFQLVISYRRVCSIWREFIDEILETSLLSNVTAWVPLPPFGIFTLFPRSVPRIEIPYGENACEAPILCPPPLQTCPKGNPFASKALKVFYPCVVPEISEKLSGILLEDLLHKFGRHLSSLCLEGLELKLDVLLKVLEYSPNLKVLVIGSLRVFDNNFSRSLPPLPHLKTLFLENFFDGDVDTRRPIVNLGSHQWFIEPYADHLVKLQIRRPTPVAKSLPMLEQLSLWYPTLTVLQQNGATACLQHLAIITHDNSCWTGNIHDVVNFLDRFTNSLVTLHLDVYWHNLTIGNEPLRFRLRFNLTEEYLNQRDSDPVMEELRRVFGRLSRTCHKRFPFLKKLAVSYPKEDIDGLLISQTFLPKFPGLEELHFLNFRQHIYQAPMYNPGEETIEPFLEREDYWRLCPHLKKIVVANGGTPDWDHGQQVFSCVRPT